MQFSNEEKLDMLEIYHVARRNVERAVAAYQETYPERRQPHKTIYSRLHTSLREHGSFNINKKGKLLGDRVPVEEENNVLTEVMKLVYMMILMKDYNYFILIYR